jgi:hypothetical protein
MRSSSTVDPEHAEPLRFQGPTLEAAVATARAALGPRTRVLEANRIRRGGIGGFFATDLGVEVTVVVDDSSIDAALERLIAETEAKDGGAPTMTTPSDEHGHSGAFAGVLARELFTRMATPSPTAAAAVASTPGPSSPQARMTTSTLAPAATPAPASTLPTAAAPAVSPPAAVAEAETPTPASRRARKKEAARSSRAAPEGPPLMSPAESYDVRPLVVLDTPTVEPAPPAEEVVETAPSVRIFRRPAEPAPFVDDGEPVTAEDILAELAAMTAEAALIETTRTYGLPLSKPRHRTPARIRQHASPARRRAALRADAEVELATAAGDVVDTIDTVDIVDTYDTVDTTPVDTVDTTPVDIVDTVDTASIDTVDTIETIDTVDTTPVDIVDIVDTVATVATVDAASDQRPSEASGSETMVGAPTTDEAPQRRRRAPVRRQVELAVNAADDLVRRLASGLDGAPQVTVKVVVTTSDGNHVEAEAQLGGQ